MNVPVESTQFFNGITNTWTLTFVWNDRPWTMNEAHNGKVNRWAANERIAEWRAAHRLMSDGCPRLEWCDITVTHVTKASSVDAVACAPAFKAALDGLRDWTDEDGVTRRGVLEDDSPRFVRSVLFATPVCGADRDALVLELRGEPA